jgi:hypothetical protein
MKPGSYSFIAALALTGCVGGISPKLSESHPANPQARQSPVAFATPMLVAGSQGLVLSVSTNETGMHHDHHQATPAKPAQKVADHKHEHEQPRKAQKK